MTQIEIRPDMVPGGGPADLKAGPEERRLVKQACEGVVVELSGMHVEVASIRTEFVRHEGVLKACVYTTFSVPGEEALVSETEVALPNQESQEDGADTDWPTTAVGNIMFAVSWRLGSELLDKGWDSLSENERRAADAFLSAVRARKSAEV